MRKRRLKKKEDRKKRKRRLKNHHTRSFIEILKVIHSIPIRNSVSFKITP